MMEWSPSISISNKFLSFNIPQQHTMAAQRNFMFDKRGDNAMTIPYHTKPQPLGGISLIAPVSVIPATNSGINPTTIRTISGSSGAPTQLTIFYAGSVNVYDDVSPEKARAIMLLAGNGSSTTQSKSDNYIGTRSHIASTYSCLPIPSLIPVASLAGSQPVELGSSTCTPLATIRPIGVSASPSHHTEPAKLSNSVRSYGGRATLASTGGLPLARKASLARFLEKRKERIKNTSPYEFKQKSPVYNIVGSEFLSFSVNSASGSYLPALH